MDSFGFSIRFSLILAMVGLASADRTCIAGVMHSLLKPFPMASGCGCGETNFAPCQPVVVEDECECECGCQDTEAEEQCANECDCCCHDEAACCGGSSGAGFGAGGASGFGTGAGAGTGFGFGFGFGGIGAVGILAAAGVAGSGNNSETPFFGLGVPVFPEDGLNTGPGGGMPIPGGGITSPESGLPTTTPLPEIVPPLDVPGVVPGGGGGGSFVDVPVVPISSESEGFESRPVPEPETWLLFSLILFSCVMKGNWVVWTRRVILFGHECRTPMTR